MRPFTVGTFMLRVKELNIPLDELPLFTMGEITDMLIERINDTEEWELLPTEADFEVFAR